MKTSSGAFYARDDVIEWCDNAISMTKIERAKRCQAIDLEHKRDVARHEKLGWFQRLFTGSPVHPRDMGWWDRDYDYSWLEAEAWANGDLIIARELRDAALAQKARGTVFVSTADFQSIRP